MQNVYCKKKKKNQIKIIKKMKMKINKINK